MNSRLLWKLCGLLIAVGVVAGCGKPAESPGPTAELRAREDQGPSTSKRAHPELQERQNIPSGIPTEELSQPQPQAPGLADSLPPVPGMEVLRPGVDPFAVPDGPPDEIFKFIESLQFAKPTGFDDKSIQEFRVKLATAVLTAAEKILAQTAQATEEQRHVAVQLKMLALTMLSEMGDTNAAQILQAYPDQLEAAGQPQLARSARAMLLLSELQESGEMTDAEVAQLAERIQKYLESGSITQNDARIIFEIFQILESRGLNDILVGFHAAISKRLASSEDEVVRQVGKIVDGLSNRASLVGKPMEVTGVTVSGEPFDWSQYQGKVVLVTFWATWCAPCRREIPTLLEAYNAYHDKGFEIVAISVDDDRQALEEFLKVNHLPWTILFDREAPGEKMSEKFGVIAVPQMILVGRDGKVVTTGIRGHNLTEYLEKLIGSPAQSPEGEMTPAGPPMLTPQG